MPGDQIGNEVTGTYIEPNLYQPADVPTRAIAAEDTRQLSYDLPHITSVYRGQRILEFYLRKAQAERRVTWPMNIMGIAISTLDTVQLATERYGLSNYAFQVSSWGLNQDFSVGLQLEETGPEMFDFDPDSYLEPGEMAVLTPADAIGDPTAPRGALRVVASDPPFPVTSSASSLTIAASSVMLDTGQSLVLPSVSIPSLTDGTFYNLFWNTGTRAYEVELDPAPTRLASPSFVFIVRQGTLNTDGTPPDVEAPPPGYGGGGGYYGGNPTPWCQIRETPPPGCS
ncbi:phage tail protein [Sphingomonas radiodurans]|uniref:phage tail protein n=1 Tax=Sphingomonas radiodurans TaxID=2890321 RepID=UPI001E559905|nr:hypothetical protein [Sphingomonas radiodurans]WBH17046.1 hypothetical protein LLW23_02690 [Sphingomonas radiodurans]